MNPPKRCIATKALFLMLALLLPAAMAHAGVAGMVANLSGPLLAKKADGTVKILAVKSNVEEGETLISEKETYARIKFIDNSEITLRPNSQLKIDSFSFEQDKQDKDNALFNLVKGGLRAVTGVLGKRSKERFGMNTPTATIGIRGTVFIAEYVEINAEAVAPGARAPGLYVQVLDGAIHLSNGGGTQNFAAGQFGYTPNFKQPPVVLPSNPGMQFTPPPSFSSSTEPQGSQASSSKTSEVDCEVR